MSKTLLLFALLPFSLAAQVYPGAIAADNSLLVAADDVTTTLTQPMLITDTSMQVAGGLWVPNSIATIAGAGGEQVEICAVMGTTLSIGHSSCPNIDGRGYAGTAAAAHASTVGVGLFQNAVFHNNTRVEVEALETALGANLANVIVGITAGTGISKTSGNSPTLANTGALSFGPSGNVRTGAIVPATGDYTATQVGLGNVLNLEQTVDPGSNGIVYRTGAGTSRDAAYADLFALFTGCTGTDYPGFDGACHVGNALTLPAGAQGQYLQIQPNTGNTTTYQFASPVAVNASLFAFPAQSCNSALVCSAGGPGGGSLSAAANNLTFTPVPLGLNGSDANHQVYVSGGTGTAEPCLITGGSGSSGQTSGPIILTCAYTHTGAWTIQSAAAGLQEAWNTSTKVALTSGSYQLYGTVTPPLFAELECPASYGNDSRGGPAFLYFNNLTGVMFNVVNDGFTMHGDCALTQVGTPTASVGIQVTGGGSGVAGTSADNGLIEGPQIAGFYHGFVGLGSGGSFNVRHLFVTSSVSDNMIANEMQGYWYDIVTEFAGAGSTAGSGNGLTLNYCTSGACGVGPMISGMQSYGNCGWGVQANANAGVHFGGDMSYLDANYNGGLYVTPVSNWFLTGAILNLSLDGNGHTPTCGVNVNGPGMQIVEAGTTIQGHLSVNHVLCNSNQGVCITNAKDNIAFHDIQSDNDNRGAQAANDYSVILNGGGSILDGSYLTHGVEINGSQNQIVDNVIQTFDAIAPAIMLGTGGTVTRLSDNNLSANLTGGTVVNCTVGNLTPGSRNTMLAAAGASLFSGVCTPSVGDVPASPYTPVVTGTSVASASTIAPQGGTVHVTGSATITNITVPVGFQAGPYNMCVNLISDGGFVTTTGGSPGIASAMTTSAGFMYPACYDGTIWTISPAASGGGSTLPVADSTTIVKGAADATKLVKISASSLPTSTVATVVVPQTTNLSGGTETVTLAAQENANSFTQPQKIQSGANAPLSSNGALQVTASSGLTLVGDFFGAASVASLRRTNGSYGSATAIVNGNALGVFSAGGYDGTTLPAGLGTGGLEVYSSENWNAAAHGSIVYLYATQAGGYTTPGNVIKGFMNAAGLSEIDPGVTGGQLGAVGGATWNLQPSMPDTTQFVQCTSCVSGNTLTTSYAAVTTMATITLPTAGKYLLSGTLDFVEVGSGDVGVFLEGEVVCTGGTSPAIGYTWTVLAARSTFPVQFYYTGASVSDVCQLEVKKTSGSGTSYMGVNTTLTATWVGN